MPRAFSVMWLSVLVAGAAWAQPASAPPAVPSPAAAAAPAPVLEPAAPPRPSMSGDEMVRQGREYRADIESTKLHVQTQVQQAREDKDVIRLNCLLDKLTQLNANAIIMDQSLHNLEQSLARTDTSGQLHEYTRITIVNQKVQVLKTEADACVGAETNYIGPTRVVVEAPAGLREEVDQLPPTQPPVSVIDRPPPASVYQ